MASLQPSNALPQPQLTIAAASITSSYVLVGTFTNAIELCNIVSTMDQPVQISFDGVNNHLVAPIGNSNPCILPLNFKTNRMVLPVTSVFVKTIGTSPTLGSLYVGGFAAIIP